MTASNVIRIRQAVVLLAASFGSCPAAANQLIFGTTTHRPREDFHLQVIRVITGSAKSALRAMPAEQKIRPADNSAGLDNTSLKRC